MHDHHHDLGPCGPGTVMMDIGPGAGALMIYADAAELGREIEISPDGTTQRTHVAVRSRHLAQGEVHCAFFPRLTVGDYTIWKDATRPAQHVTVSDGQVTEVRWL